MNKSKISSEEINALRQKAEAERETRRQIEADTRAITTGVEPPESWQMMVLNRGHAEEVIAMMEAYKQQGCLTLADNVQIYLYENRYKDVLRVAWLALSEHLPLCYKLEERMIQEPGYLPKRQLSVQAEQLLLRSRLKNQRCLDCVSGYNFFNHHFHPIREYFKKFDLNVSSECYLMQEYLGINSDREQYAESCRDVVQDYIKQKRYLSLEAEKLLIASGDHELIMLYIQVGVLKAESELLERGNREEVVAYFERYATL